MMCQFSWCYHPTLQLLSSIFQLTALVFRPETFNALWLKDCKCQCRTLWKSHVYTGFNLTCANPSLSSSGVPRFWKIRLQDFTLTVQYSEFNSTFHCSEQDNKKKQQQHVFFFPSETVSLLPGIICRPRCQRFSQELLSTEETQWKLLTVKSVDNPRRCGHCF